MPAHHLKNIAGKRAAAQIAKEAAIGTGIVSCLLKFETF